MRVCYFSFLLCCVEILIGCGFRLYPPVAHLERTSPIYPDARPQNCTLKVLSGPPEEPFEVFAQVISYAGSAEMADKMVALIKQNACEAGAEAIVLLPMQHGKHSNTDNIYPDWVVGSTERFQHWVDKRYAVSQRAFALVFKRGNALSRPKSGS